MDKEEHKQTQGRYVAFYTDEYGNRIRIPEGSIEWVMEGEEDIPERRDKPRFNLLEWLKRLEASFNNKFGWFFTNGMK